MDMYRRRIETDKLVYISKALVNIYMSNSQTHCLHKILIKLSANTYF